MSCCPLSVACGAAVRFGRCVILKSRAVLDRGTLQFVFSEKPGALGAAVKLQAPCVFSKVGKNLLVYSEK